MGMFEYYYESLELETVSRHGTFAGIDVSAANSDDDYEDRYAEYNYQEAI